MADLPPQPLEGLDDVLQRGKLQVSESLPDHTHRSGLISVSKIATLSFFVIAALIIGFGVRGDMTLQHLKSSLNRLPENTQAAREVADMSERRTNTSAYDNPSWCFNEKKDGDESDVDCGGTRCSRRCEWSYACVVSQDCSNNMTCSRPLTMPPNAENHALLQAGAQSVLMAQAGANQLQPPFIQDRAVSPHVVSGYMTKPTPAPTTPGGRMQTVCHSPESCFNGVRESGETAVDCGGTCPKCQNYQTCKVNTDCLSHNCITYPNPIGGAPLPSRCYPVSSCDDGLWNGNETDVDCGGNCRPCKDFKTCVSNYDCISDNCKDYKCRFRIGCTNGVKDGSETDVDCGGNCKLCDMWLNCKQNSDCLSYNCQGNRCRYKVTCTNGVKDGSETGTDCGGNCPKCAIGSTCITRADCISGYCKAPPAPTASPTSFSTSASELSFVPPPAIPTPAPMKWLCAARPTCFDSLLNGKETDVDCGGPACPACSDFKKCQVGPDCNSQVCVSTNGTKACSPASCFNGIIDGGESDVDCGGQCKPCQPFELCRVDSDCFPPCLSADQMGPCGQCVYSSPTTALNNSIPTATPTVTPTGLLGVAGSGHCAGTQYPTPVPTLAPTQNTDKFTSGSIIAQLPPLYDISWVENCTTTWEECLKNSPQARSCSLFSSQDQTGVSNQLYKNWQNEQTLPKSEWFGCQLLAQTIDGGRNYGNPGALMPWAPNQCFSPRTLVNMIADGCYLISLQAQAKTTSFTSRWASSSEYISASSKSQSSQTGGSVGFGAFFSASASYATSKSSSSATSGSNTNVGATINRNIEIASITNQCLNPAVTPRETIKARLDPKVVELGEKVVTDYDVIDASGVVGITWWETGNGEQANVRLPTLKSVGYARELASFGQIIPFDWRYAYYYIQEFKLTGSTASSVAASANSKSYSVSAGGRYEWFSAAMSRSSGNSQAATSATAASTSNVQIHVETQGNCPWYQNANLGGPPPQSSQIADAAGQAAAQAAAATAKASATSTRRLMSASSRGRGRRLINDKDCEFLAEEEKLMKEKLIISMDDQLAQKYLERVQRAYKENDCQRREKLKRLGPRNEAFFSKNAEMFPAQGNGIHVAAPEVKNPFRPRHELDRDEFDLEKRLPAEAAAQATPSEKSERTAEVQQLERKAEVAKTQKAQKRQEEKVKETERLRGDEEYYKARNDAEKQRYAAAAEQEQRTQKEMKSAVAMAQGQMAQAQQAMAGAIKMSSVVPQGGLYSDKIDSALQYDAWQRCDTSDFRTWGGMQPVVQDLGFSDIPDVLFGTDPRPESFERIRRSEADKALFMTATFRAMTATSGRYAFASSVSSLVDFVSDPLFELESCDRSRGSGRVQYNNDFCYNIQDQFNGELIFPSPTPTPTPAPPSNCGSWCQKCCKWGNASATTCTDGKCLEMFDPVKFPQHAWAFTNLGKRATSVGCGHQGFTDSLSSSCFSTALSFTYDQFCNSKSLGMVAVKVWSSNATQLEHPGYSTDYRTFDGDCGGETTILPPSKKYTETTPCACHGTNAYGCTPSGVGLGTIPPPSCSNPCGKSTDYCYTGNFVNDQAGCSNNGDQLGTKSGNEGAICSEQMLYRGITLADCQTHCDADVRCKGVSYSPDPTYMWQYECDPNCNSGAPDLKPGRCCADRLATIGGGTCILKNTTGCLKAALSSSLDNGGFKFYGRIPAPLGSTPVDTAGFAVECAYIPSSLAPTTSPTPAPTFPGQQCSCKKCGNDISFFNFGTCGSCETSRPDSGCYTDDCNSGSMCDCATSQCITTNNIECSCYQCGQKTPKNFTIGTCGKQAACSSDSGCYTKECEIFGAGCNCATKECFSVPTGTPTASPSRPVDEPCPVCCRGVDGSCGVEVLSPGGVVPGGRGYCRYCPNATVAPSGWACVPNNSSCDGAHNGKHSAAPTISSTLSPTLLPTSTPTTTTLKTPTPPPTDGAGKLPTPPPTT